MFALTHSLSLSLSLLHRFQVFQIVLRDGQHRRAQDDQTLLQDCGEARLDGVALSLATGAGVTLHQHC